MEELRSGANAQAVTTSDSTIYSGIRAVYVGGAGDIALKFPGNNTAVVFVGVPAGSFLSLKPTHIMATGTTATSIVAIF